MSLASHPVVHNPISGLSDPRAGLVVGRTQARAMFRARLTEMHAELAPVVRIACKLPASEMPAAAFAEWMCRGIDTAIDCGMSSVEDVVGFMALMRSVGPRFHEFPAVKKYFARADLPANGRILGLFEAVPMTLWAVVQRHSGGAR